MGKTGSGVSRNTYALFMEPNFEEPMMIPKGRSVENVLKEDPTKMLPPLHKRWKPEMDFETFEMNTFSSFAVM